MTVEITASGSTLEKEAFPIEIEVPNEIAENKEALDEFINNYLDENEIEVKEWVLSDMQEAEMGKEEDEIEVPF